MTTWTNYTPDQITAIVKLLPSIGEPGTARLCPSCGDQEALRWYSYRNPFRNNSMITYVWCSGCRHYSGETTEDRGWDLPDPLSGASRADRIAMESTLDTFFSRLNELWRSGELPQVRPSKPR
jgi:hypothetical protein